MKKSLFLFILLCSTTLVAGQALAITLSFDPSCQAIYPGNTVSLDLNISGLTAGGPDSLGAFDLDITFNDSVLTFDSVVFGSFLGDPDPLAFETSIFVDTSTSGEVRLQELSWLFDWELDALQPASFTLATLTFLGSNLGYSAIGLDNVVLSDAFGIQLPDPTLQGAGINVVPEPATFLLLGSGLAGLVGLRKKFKVRSS